MSATPNFNEISPNPQTQYRMFLRKFNHGRLNEHFDHERPPRVGTNKITFYLKAGTAPSVIGHLEGTHLAAKVTVAVYFVWGEDAPAMMVYEVGRDGQSKAVTEKPTTKKQKERHFQIRDRRGKNRYYIDNIFLRQGYGAKVGPYGIAIYNALCLHVDYDDQDCYPSYRLLAELTGMSKRQAMYKIQELEDLNIIEVKRRREGKKNLTNEIVLTAVSEWEKINQTST